MRLIDADELKKEIIALWDLNVIDDPAKNILIYYIETEETVNAIHIEWIKEYLVKLHKEGKEERDYVINELGGYGPVYKYIYETGIEKMIKDWEKENEQN